MTARRGGIVINSESAPGKLMSKLRGIEEMFLYVLLLVRDDTLFPLVWNVHTIEFTARRFFEY